MTQAGVWRTRYKNWSYCFRTDILKVWFQQHWFLKISDTQNQDPSPSDSDTMTGLWPSDLCFNISPPHTHTHTPPKHTPESLWCTLRFQTHWFGTWWPRDEAEKPGKQGVRGKWGNVRAERVLSHFRGWNPPFLMPLPASSYWFYSTEWLPNLRIVSQLARSPCSPPTWQSSATLATLNHSLLFPQPPSCIVLLLLSAQRLIREGNLSGTISSNIKCHVHLQSFINNKWGQ